MSEEMRVRGELGGGREREKEREIGSGGTKEYELSGLLRIPYIALSTIHSITIYWLVLQSL